MLKVISLVRRRPELDHDRFAGLWEDVVADAVTGRLQPDRCVMTVFDQHRVVGAHQYDGMVVLVFSEPEKGRRVLDTAAAGGPRSEGTDLLGEVVRLETEEHVFFDRGSVPPQPRKLTYLVVPRPGTTHAAVKHHWVSVHGPAVAAPMKDIPGALRYVASPAIEPTGVYSGVTELWYADRDASRAHAAAVTDDGFARLADNSIYLTGHELVVR